MENFGSLSGRSIGNLKSKLDVRQYALEVALGLPEEDKLGKAKEIEDYLLGEIEMPGYFDPNATTNELLKKVSELSTPKATDKTEKQEEKTNENLM